MAVQQHTQQGAACGGAQGAASLRNGYATETVRAPQSCCNSSETKLTTEDL